MELLGFTGSCDYSYSFDKIYNFKTEEYIVYPLIIAMNKLEYNPKL